MKYIISSGPNPPEAKEGVTQYLDVWPVSGSTNGQDNWNRTTAWSSGLSAENCDKVDLMLAAARGLGDNY